MDSKTLSQIRAKLSHFALAWEPNAWLDTGIPDLNRVLGHTDRGLAYGRIIEMSGWESVGKTAITMAIAALAQWDGAVVIWADVENSFDPGWALLRKMRACPKCNGTGIRPTAKGAVSEKDPQDCPNCGGTKSPTCGLDPEYLVLIQPYVGKFGKEKEDRLSTAQELLNEAEACVKTIPKKSKCVLVLDSIAALLTEGESAVGIEGASMRSDMDLPKFLSRLLRRWVGLAQAHNAMIILTNQLRQGPSKFASTYTVGGNAPRFYCHVRTRARRVVGSKIMDKGIQVGITGVLTAKKNKCGGLENSEVGYRVMFKSAVEFIPAKTAKANEKDD